MPRNYSFVLPWKDFNHRLELFSILFILVCVDIALRLGSYLDTVYVCLYNAQNVCRPRTPVRHIRPNVSASHVCLYIYLYLLDCELNWIDVCCVLVHTNRHIQFSNGGLNATKSQLFIENCALNFSGARRIRCSNHTYTHMPPIIGVPVLGKWPATNSHTSKWMKIEGKKNIKNEQLNKTASTYTTSMFVEFASDQFPMVWQN